VDCYAQLHPHKLKLESVPEFQFCLMKFCVVYIIDYGIVRSMVASSTVDAAVFRRLHL